MKKDKIVIIGANDFQNQLIIKAKARGMETHVFAWEKGAVGKKNADFFYPISIIEKEKILQICREIQPNGVVSIASDLAALTVNYIAEKLNLIGNGMDSARVSTNKYLMRKAFEKRGDPSPKCYYSDELSNINFKSLRWPLIVKPVDRSGSRGITKISDLADLSSAIRSAEKESFSKKAIVEEFVEGEEFSVEYISYKGVHTFLALTKKYTTGAPHFIETGHVQPAAVSDEILNKIKGIVEHALDTLMIKNGASHSELKVDNNGKIKIIEIGGRMGGDCIGSDLVQLSTGVDFINMVIDVACGRKPVFKKVCVPQKAEVRFIFNQEDINQLERIKLKNPESLYRVSDIDIIDSEHPVTDSSTRYGYYIVRG
ncbi:ATP-grasp domain-containing protein [Clostridium sp. AM58-1XD]|uniref:ATP-grasp domain-containing protein n=1 Tax=Clostridium sp. AM58-1XD TaxID=2292307 RepID=UPI000E46A5DC|nr:ATP-grasp domain-containing protein [Clostridium sp. AM58-1XD]RGY94783.1 ATP-grasp domain-containing protein [Clostridium sp. AM58-1XD]